MSFYETVSALLHLDVKDGFRKRGSLLNCRSTLSRFSTGFSLYYSLVP